MNIFQPDARFISGLGDMGFVGTIFFAFFGPLVTFGLFIWFAITLIQNIIPLARKNTPPAEKEAAKKSLLWWGVCLFVAFTAMLIVTTLFFSLGQQVSNSGGGGTTIPSSDSLAIEINSWLFKV